MSVFLHFLCDKIYNRKDVYKMIQIIKEMIRLNIKPNFAALGREYGCDYRTAKIRYYEELNKEKGITIFISSHLLSEIEKTCTHVGIINQGKLLFEG